MLAAEICTEAVERLGSSKSRSAVAVNSAKEPRTLLTMACRATKPMRLWDGSITYVPLSAAGVTAGVTAAVVMGPPEGWLRMQQVVALVA
jgi:hypothetical protein